MKPKQKVYAFIDSQNLNLSIKGDIFRKGKPIYKGWRLDFQRFRKHLTDKYKVDKCFLFIGLVPTNAMLYANLQKYGYHLVFKPTLVHKEKDKEIVKGNVDAELVLHTMIEFQNFDKAIIVSGDGDFKCLHDYLNENDKLGRILIPNEKSFSSLLWDYRNKMDFINRLKSKLELKEKKRGVALSTGT
ncbi:NYN domain-containing protein [Candidatus Dojkabacteria bacterium]|nr:NYN domain-containing protein [Candidatus Dojkabacteria bacterium]